MKYRIKNVHNAYWIEGFETGAKDESTLLFGEVRKGKVKPYLDFNKMEKKLFKLRERKGE